MYKKYKIEFNGKSYTYRANNAAEALEKFASRKVFGRDLICGYKVEQYDADTRGKTWLRASTNSDGERQIIDITALHAA